jgi:predicted PurR-regulated permease PerM
MGHKRLAYAFCILCVAASFGTGNLTQVGAISGFLQDVGIGTCARTALCVLAFAGVEYGALWGILAGILDALPFIGTGIVLVPLAVVQLLAGRIGQAVVCLVLYAGCAFLREWLEPRLIGKKAGIPPVAVVVSVYAGIRLFGLSGILKGPLGLMMVLLIRKSLQRRDW